MSTVGHPSRRPGTSHEEPGLPPLGLPRRVPSSRFLPENAPFRPINPRRSRARRRLSASSDGWTNGRGVQDALHRQTDQARTTGPARGAEWNGEASSCPRGSARQHPAQLLVARPPGKKRASAAAGAQRASSAPNTLARARATIAPVEVGAADLDARAGDRLAADRGERVCLGAGRSSRCSRRGCGHAVPAPPNRDRERLPLLRVAPELGEVDRDADQERVELAAVSRQPACVRGQLERLAARRPGPGSGIPSARACTGAGRGRKALSPRRRTDRSRRLRGPDRPPRAPARTALRARSSAPEDRPSRLPLERVAYVDTRAILSPSPARGAPASSRGDS